MKGTQFIEFLLMKELKIFSLSKKHCNRFQRTNNYRQKFNTERASWRAKAKAKAIDQVQET